MIRKVARIGLLVGPVAVAVLSFLGPQVPIGGHPVPPTVSGEGWSACPDPNRRDQVTGFGPGQSCPPLQ